MKYSISEILAVKRKELGWNRNRMADECGLDRATYWRIENGKVTNPDPEKLRQIEKVAGLPIGTLTGDVFRVAFPRNILTAAVALLACRFRQDSYEFTTYADGRGETHGAAV